MVGGDGRTPTERLRGRGVQRPVYELGEKVLFLPLAPARRGDFGARFDCGIYLGCRSFDDQAYIGTPSGVIRCRTVRQLSAQERWDTEFVLSIKGTPVLSRRRVCWRCQHPCGSPPRAELTEACIRQILTAPIISRRMRLTTERCSRGLVSPPMLGLPCHSNRNWVPGKPR